MCSRGFISDSGRVVYCYVDVSSLWILYEAQQIVVPGRICC